MDFSLLWACNTFNLQHTVFTEAYTCGNILVVSETNDTEVDVSRCSMNYRCNNLIDLGRVSTKNAVTVFRKELHFFSRHILLSYTVESTDWRQEVAFSKSSVVILTILIAIFFKH